jgi:hypothetical protein
MYENWSNFVAHDCKLFKKLPSTLAVCGRNVEKSQKRNSTEPLKTACLHLTAGTGENVQNPCRPADCVRRLWVAQDSMAEKTRHS